ncbi:MAG: hypothetical protein QMD09_11090, partial [Desulfatibacillaceae bacterium]|nr:hypothetical protein [Desulfatibacillaceae bacterium]
MSYIASMDARTKVEKARFLFRLGAPFALVFFILLRIYLETEVFALNPAFSYYRTLHLLFWFLNTFFLGYILGCLLGRLHPVNFMWGGYAISIMLLAIVWSMVTGDLLDIDYYRGGWAEKVKHIFTFGLTAPHNHPIIPGAVLAWLGMLFAGYFYSRHWGRSILMAVGSFFIIAAFATVWMGPAGRGDFLVPVTTRLTIHPFLASFYVSLHFFIFLPIMALAGFFKKDGLLWLVSGLIGLGAWILYIATALAMGWFGDSIFDAVVTGLPIGACIFLLVRIIFWIAGREGHPLALVGFAWLLASQILVMGPIYAGIEHRLTRTHIWGWQAADPFVTVRLVQQDDFPHLAGAFNDGSVYHPLWPNLLVRLPMEP